MRKLNFSMGVDTDCESLLYFLVELYHVIRQCTGAFEALKNDLFRDIYWVFFIFPF